MWTDGRYFIQASQELDCNWTLMKDGEDDVPTMQMWMESELKEGLKNYCFFSIFYILAIIILTTILLTYLRLTSQQL